MRKCTILLKVTLVLYKQTVDGPIRPVTHRKHQLTTLTDQTARSFASRGFSVAQYAQLLLLTGTLSSYILRVLISPQPDLLPDVFCLMVRIFRLMLVLLYI